jgi:hypothetical protein
MKRWRPRREDREDGVLVRALVPPRVAERYADLAVDGGIRSRRVDRRGRRMRAPLGNGSGTYSAAVMADEGDAETLLAEDAATRGRWCAPGRKGGPERTVAVPPPCLYA